MSDIILNRHRRLRSSTAIRSIVAGVNLSPSDLILPLFATDQKSEKSEIASLQGVFRLGEKELFEAIQKAQLVGITAIALFPVIDANHKTKNGEYALNEGNFIFKRIRNIKQKFPNMLVIADIALDPYTNHGHDGILNSVGDVDNDKTVEILARQAIALADAGADIVAPSDMMDGRVFAIRLALEKNGNQNTMILSYSAKYASHLYAPFRDAVGSSSNLKKADKKTYQMDFRNAEEALNEVESDIEQGADMVMVKPAMLYQDVIRMVKDNFNIPIFAYQVSGEYSMLKKYANNDNETFNNILIESLTSIKRSGATAIFTYGAIEVAEIINNLK